MTTKLKRAYEPAARADGYRVLVERLWPRGVRKQDLVLDEWLKDIAPSTELRQWFSHDPERWIEFKRRYLEELRVIPAKGALTALAARASKGTLTLVFSSHDSEHNNAVVLLEQLARKGRRARPRASARKAR